MSTNDLVSIFLSIELQSYGCAPYEAYIGEVSKFTHKRIYVLSDIFGSHWEYLPWVVTYWKANNSQYCIADYKSVYEMGLPLFDMYINGDNYGQDDELDTYRAAQLGQEVLSRISRLLIGILNVNVGSPYDGDCRKPYTHFNIEDINAQGPKVIKSNLNTNVSQLRDLTAYSTRGRSFHSSSHAKGNSRKSILLNEHVSNIKGTNESNLLEGDKLNMSVST